MACLRSSIAVALLISLTLHLVVLVAPGLNWRAPRAWPEPMRLRVTLTNPVSGDRHLPNPAPLSPSTTPAPSDAPPVPEPTPISPVPPVPSPDESPLDTRVSSVETVPPSTAATPSPDAPQAGESLPIEPREGDTDYPPKGEIHYALFRGTQDFEIGKGVLKWEISDDRYRLTLDAETTGAASLLLFFRYGSMRPVQFSMESVGRFGPSGFTPEQYRTWKNGEERHRVEFHWESGELKIDERPPVPLMTGSQDLLSQMFQFGYSVFPQSMAVSARAGMGVWIATGRKYERIAFETPEARILDLSAAEPPSPAQQEGLLPFRNDTTAEQSPGAFDVLYLRASSDNFIEFWLAQDYLMLPLQIRIQLSDENETYELRARELMIDDPDAPEEPTTDSPESPTPEQP